MCVCVDLQGHSGSNEKGGECCHGNDRSGVREAVKGQRDVVPLLPHRQMETLNEIKLGKVDLAPKYLESNILMKCVNANLPRM